MHKRRFKQSAIKNYENVFAQIDASGIKEVKKRGD
jgi:hypothetical protein